MSLRTIRRFRRVYGYYIRLLETVAYTRIGCRRPLPPTPTTTPTHPSP